MKIDPQTMDFRDLHHLLAGAIRLADRLWTNLMR